ncbi:MAG: transposase, partial [Candidatus Thiosymbion ectosymbiont of Robbea hypermnestra]|nr:transposase [Candidatus Thiosymbion ectosymbiont of Robbea hypermnestra]
SLADLHEVHDMLSNRVESWTDQWKREGLQQGLEQGYQATRHLLARQAHHRFGPAVATQAEPLLTRIADPVQLADLGDALLSCPDGIAWLHVLRQAGATSTAGDKDS